jgi:Uma2 family endonuclease
MGMPAVEQRRWTAAEVRAIPSDGKRYEVVDGELLVSPGPPWSHQAAVFYLQRALHDYVRAHSAGFVLDGPADVEPDDYTLVEPDVFVVPLIGGKRPRDWREAQRLLLVIEVLSPSSRRYDRVVKRGLYRRMGAEYWIVDLDAQLVERWMPGDDRPEVLSDSIEWTAPGVSESVRIDLVELWREAGPDVSALT